MNDKKIADLSFGQDNEIRVRQRLERLFGPLETTAQMDEFDFKNDNFIIELKTRRVTKNKYPSTMVGENKVVKGFEHQIAGKRVFFVFDFVDCMCLWELNRDEYHVKHGGRWDRGKAEIKSYCYIPTKYLLEVKEDADKITAERTEAGTHHEEAVRQATVQNAGRNHQEQQEEGQEAGQEDGPQEEALGPEDPEGEDDDTFLVHRDSDAA
jgi:hypothetical protein